jgi:hypothetical protein
METLAPSRCRGIKTVNLAHLTKRHGEAFLWIVLAFARIDSEQKYVSKLTPPLFTPWTKTFASL